MCLFTHFAAGALAGGLTGNPWLGLVAGAASHAVLDAIPHYDHPDWRVELSAGVASLILLLLMPFASLPAILGGLAGMLPDLENLFQKLGKMRRDQFIFPSHTGLIPHGRTLGPRTLVWQGAIFVVCFALLGLLNPGQASAAQDRVNHEVIMGYPQVQVLSQGQDLTRLKIDFPAESLPANWLEVDERWIKWALPSYLDQDSGPEDKVLPPRLDLTLAVPTIGNLQVTASGVSWWRQPNQAFHSSNLVQFGQPAIWRSVPLASGTVALGSGGGVLRSIILDVAHPATGKARQQLRLARDFQASGQDDNWSETPPSGVLNPQLLQALSRGGRQLALQEMTDKAGSDKGLYNHFDLTDNWVRLNLAQTGVYRLTGQDLTQLGVDAQDVDPTKLRVFQGGALALDLDPTVDEAAQPQRVGLTEVAIQVIDGDDGEWNLDDEFRFYGTSTSVWTDRLDPDAAALDHYEHPYSDTGIFWITWESIATSSPLPGAPLRVAEVAAPANGQNLTNLARRRVHAEEHTSDAAGIVADNWAWDTSVYSSRTGQFPLHRPVADSLATFVINFRGNPPHGSSSLARFVANGWVNGNTGDQVSTEFVRDAQHDSLRCRLVGQTSGLLHGENSFVLQNGGASPKLPLALDSFDILYWGDLDMRGVTDPFPIIHWQDQVTSAGQPFDLQITVADPEKTIIWDVSDPLQPTLLQGDAGRDQPSPWE